MAVGKIDHVGIAVQSLEEALGLFRDALGLSFQGTEELPDRHLKVAFLQVGESRFELLEPTDPESTVYKFLQKKGEGIHHVALNVENIEESMKSLEQKGYTLLDKTPKPGSGGTRIAFVHPKSTNGVLLELVEGHHE
ncbi:MAG TPA: methylmalonyl-CoA epimerase [Thermotogota bacterium]|mgnify:CR=1 FL=1|nr:methylmalonyl-CoA epimerase [Thermotogota bacterium]HRW93473.1 methylmalonyl-CoA epimerase [Thermotogota bacterium]